MSSGGAEGGWGRGGAILVGDNTGRGGSLPDAENDEVVPRDSCSVCLPGRRPLDRQNGLAGIQALKGRPRAEWPRHFALVGLARGAHRARTCLTQTSSGRSVALAGRASSTGPGTKLMVPIEAWAWYGLECEITRRPLEALPELRLRLWEGDDRTPVR